jgi:hypothetical protein
VAFVSGSFASYVPFFKVGIEACVLMPYDLCLAHRTIFHITLYFAVTSCMRSLKSIYLTFVRIRPFRACFRTNTCQVAREGLLVTKVYKLVCDMSNLAILDH